ncbi:MAG: putative porin [Gammaproteobacteria bacterium]|nr:putative porin [Gammaproteobacteria bacterium]
MTVRKQAILIFFLILMGSGALAQGDFLDEEESPGSRLEFFGDAQLRGDAVRDLPRPVDSDFDRTTLRARFGFLWLVNDMLDVGVAGKINQSSESNAETRFNLDNEKADDESVDELFLRVNYAADSEFLFGQSRFPFELTPALWDQDLRPQGVSLRHRFALGTFSSFDITAGAFLGNHIFEDESRVSAVQVAWRFNQGRRTEFELALAYLDFEEMDELALNGLRRTNLSAPDGTFLNDFNIADLQFAVKFGQRRFPVEIRLDAFQNLEADDQGDAARIDFIFGDSFRRKGFEFGLASQRIQREALPGAFNDDDWWFPTWMRGTTAWFAYGFNESFRIKLAGFRERRDDQVDHNKRVLLDLQWFF